MLSRQAIFHPFTTLGIALLAAALFSLLIVLRFDGEFRSFLLMYFAPIGVPFVAYLLDRLERRHEIRFLQWVVDLLVLVLSLARAFVLIPLISGHALFLTYALVSTRSWVARITATIVLVEVCYLKLAVWHDLTLLGGVVLGCMAFAIFRYFNADIGYQLDTNQS